MLHWGEERVRNFFFFKNHLILLNVQQHRKGVNFLFGGKKKKKTTKKWNNFKAWHHTSSKTKNPQDLEKLERKLCFFLMILHLAKSSVFYPFRGEGCRSNPHSSSIGIQQQLLNNLLIPWREETLCFFPLLSSTLLWWWSLTMVVCRIAYWLPFRPST